MKSLSMVEGSRERETSALMDAVLGMILKVQLCCYPQLASTQLRQLRGARTDLCVSKLDQTRLVHHNLIPIILTRVEQLRQSEPLPRHLIPVIGIHELIIVDAVGGVPLYALDGGFTAVECDDVVDEALAGGGELDAGGGVGRVVF